MAHAGLEARAGRLARVLGGAWVDDARWRRLVHMYGAESCVRWAAADVALSEGVRTHAAVQLARLCREHADGGSVAFAVAPIVARVLLRSIEMPVRFDVVL